MSRAHLLDNGPSPQRGQPKLRPRAAFKPPKEQLFIPIGTKVVLDLIAPKETEAGLALPDGSTDPRRIPEAIVVAYGPECKQVRLGDSVITLSGTPAGDLTFEGQDYKVVQEEYIIGILNRETKSLVTNEGSK